MPGFNYRKAACSDVAKHTKNSINKDTNTKNIKTKEDDVAMTTVRLPNGKTYQRKCTKGKVPMPDISKPAPRKIRAAPTEPSPYLKLPEKPLPKWETHEKVRCFVINLKKDTDKWEKYQKANDSGVLPYTYERFEACNGVEERETNPFEIKILKRYNCHPDKRSAMAGIFYSHMKLLRKIADEKIERAIIFQDDAVLRPDLFQQLKGCKEVMEADTMVYLTGTIFPPNKADLDKVFRSKKLRDAQWQGVLKSFGKETNPPSLKDIKGEYRMLGAYCTLIPKPEVAERLYNILDTKKRVRSIDTEWTYLQNSGEICSQVLWPPVAALVYEDAIKGVHPEYMRKERDGARY